MSEEALYQIALTRIPQVGDIRARALIQHFGSASAIFKAKRKQLFQVENLASSSIEQLLNFHDFSGCEKELRHCEKHRIKMVFFTDADYPRRLTHCIDAPILLFQQGSANLNAEKVIAVVGTRANTLYGEACVHELIMSLSAFEPTVISGLAYGIDTIAHKSAVEYHLPTIGVLAHGLQNFYPPENVMLWRRMEEHGGAILTELPYNTKADRHYFPTRNRIVAGMADATVVVETDLKGGSMITANLANGYNRDVFAYPGRASDGKSNGCNELIRTNGAALITSGGQLAEAMGWVMNEKPKQVQRQLFIELSPQEQATFEVLNNGAAIAVDEISVATRLPASSVAAALLSLELQGIIKSLPGKMYKVI